MDSNKNKETILLLINNDERSRSIISSLNDKYSFLTASNTVEAFSKMTFNIPSLLIADLDMDDVDVLTFLKTVRNGIKTKLIPFISISSDNSHNNRIKAIEYGVDAYLQYPFIPQELKAIVRSILNKFNEFYLLTITDELTRLYNRKEFIKKFNDQCNLPGVKEISCAIIDIDHFKLVNDLYGHVTGDAVLMKLAKLLKDYSSNSFFPARFGGEEFVVLFTGKKILEASKTIKHLLKEFSSIEFKVNRKSFNVTFSAGLSEYPTMGQNISELLSRADQALYSAKNDGRNLVYTFNPVMARNDKFWESLKTRKEIYIHDKIFESTTKLPYLPNLLNIVANLDFEVQSVGILIISLKTILDYDSCIGYKNFVYDIENIKRIILKSTELVFPSDTHAGIGDIYNYDFVVLFPSVVDFSFNLIKFKEICKEISQIINENLKSFPIDISYSSEVAMLSKTNPRRIINDIDIARKNNTFISDKMRFYNAYQKSFKNISKLYSISELIKLKACFNCSTMNAEYQYFTLKKPFEIMNLFSIILQEQIDTPKKLKELLNLCLKTFMRQIHGPLLFPYLTKIDPSSMIKTLHDEFGDTKIILMVNEYHLYDGLADSIHAIQSDLPDNIAFGLNNCFIGSDILSLLSMNNFHILAFSDNIIRNIHFFKNRMEVISGLTQFLDQISVPSLAYSVHSDAEYQLINDLRINYCSGNYIEQLLKKNKRSLSKAKM